MWDFIIGLHMSIFFTQEGLVSRLHISCTKEGRYLVKKKPKSTPCNVGWKSINDCVELVVRALGAMSMPCQSATLLKMHWQKLCF
jgi:hypothetical protein